ncbi:MAG TPA: homogentisate 1,2-dioxygenase [Haliangiales bacterium]|nr:homogentisate 1,2-dioxygenase [Haliangiales bacterium]
MLDRVVAGEVPRKHHIALRDAEGNLRYEECFTRDGFDGPYSILYHARRPHTQRLAEAHHGFDLPRPAPERPLAKRHFLTGRVEQTAKPPVDARVPILYNEDVVLSIARPGVEDPVYFANGDGDDLYFVWKGGGTVRSPFGDLRFGVDDYVCVPRGIPHRIIPDAGEQHWLAIECAGGLGLLKQWRNDVGQLRMDAPYSHRDFRRPTFSGPRDEGIRQLVVKRSGGFHGFAYVDSPLDVVGWDGTVYPWAFPMLAFQPKVGLVHLPPIWHGTFGARGALICSFVPRLVDFHPEAIPCPYPHSSPSCDEFLFYVRGQFTSRKGVGPGSVSLHPAGIPHGPHPGAYEASIGSKETGELAVMIDTFRALRQTTEAARIEDPGYQESFI